METLPNNSEGSGNLLNTMQALFHGFDEDGGSTSLEDFIAILKELNRNADGDMFLEIRPRALSESEWIQLYKCMPERIQQWLAQGARVRAVVERQRREVNNMLGGFTKVN